MIIGIDARPLAQKHLTGTAEYTLGLLRSLLEIDDRNEYHLFFNSFHKVNLPDLPQKNVKIFASRIPNKIFNLPLQRLLQLPKIDKKIKADIFFQPSLGFLALSSSVPKILTIHDLSFLLYKEFFSYRMRLWHYLVNIKKQAQQADKIIAVSKNTKNDIINLLGAEENKIEVIYSGLSDEILQRKPISDEERKEARRKYNLPQKYLLTLSTIEPRKNLDGIITAFDAYVEESGDKEMFLVIAGGEGWCQGKIIEALSGLKNQKQIRFTGYIEKEDKKILFEEAEAFLYLSFYEGFGFPPLEAMASGTPSIVSANSSLAEICGDLAYMVNPQKTQEISEMIKIILKNNKLTNISSDIPEIVKNTFSWARAAEAHIRLFKDLEKN